MTVSHREPTLISQSELCRLLNLPAPRIAKAIRDGRITPDQKVCGRLNLFDRARIPEIRAAMGTIVKTAPFGSIVIECPLDELAGALSNNRNGEIEC